jgi:hypothetical protein
VESPAVSFRESQNRSAFTCMHPAQDMVVTDSRCCCSDQRAPSCLCCGVRHWRRHFATFACNSGKQNYYLVSQGFHCPQGPSQLAQYALCETVPGTGEVARFPVETLGTHKDGNTEHNVTSTGSPLGTHSVSDIHHGSRRSYCSCVCMYGRNMRLKVLSQHSMFRLDVQP